MTLAIQDHFADPILDDLPSREIDIDNRGNSSELTDYQVTVDVSNHVGKQEMRFVDENLQIVDYWEEDSGIAWAEIPKIIGGKVSAVRLVCGDIESKSDGEATFEFFDDFEYSGAPDSSKWTIDQSGYVEIESGRLKISAVSNHNSIIHSTPSFLYPIVIQFKQQITKHDNYVAAHVILSDTGVWWSDDWIIAGDIEKSEDYPDFRWCSINEGLATDSFINNVDILEHIFKVIWESDNIEYFQDSNSVTNITSNIADDYMHITLALRDYGGYTGNTYYDDIFIRKYTSPEPTAVIA